VSDQLWPRYASPADLEDNATLGRYALAWDTKERA
jgi:hypothetical protein